MWLLIFAGLLAVSVGQEAVSVAAEKPEASVSKADDLVLLEIDAKEPAKRSPITASAVYGAAPNGQFIVRHGDDAQELSPEYLALVQPFPQGQLQAYNPTTAAPIQQQKALPGYARQQQQLQTAYHNRRVVPQRPRVQLHTQSLSQAEAAAQVQAQGEAHIRADALRQLRLGASASESPAYQVAAYPEPKLGTFEQELLQLVSANQAQEFKLEQQPRQPALKAAPQPLQYYPTSQYANAEVDVQPQAPQLVHEQYHVETTRPRYHQGPNVQSSGYQQEGQGQLAFHQVIGIRPAQPKQQPQQQIQLQYPQSYPDVDPNIEAQQIARAQANAQAQALAFRKIAHASHLKHQQAAFEQIRQVHERHRQQTALEQIKEGEAVSDAGRAHIEEQVRPKDPQAEYKARVRAEASAAAAEARRIQEAAEHKAHTDAILKLQEQQRAHIRAQEEATHRNLNFERDQMRAQAQAQAIANAQALALYKAHQAARAKAQKEAQAAAHANQQAKRLDPENTPAVQFLLPNAVPLPSPNSYFTNDQVQKYQAEGSQYVARAAPKAPSPADQEDAQITYAQAIINQPRQPHKHKIPQTSQSSVYVSSQSGHLKKAPVKSVNVQDIIEQDRTRGSQFIRIPSPKGRTLTQDDVQLLINAGFTVTPVPETHRPTEQPAYAENTSTGYYIKKQRQPVARPDYVTYEQVVPNRRIHKQRPILKQHPIEEDASEKITFLVPIEPAYGTRQTQLDSTE